MKTIKHLEGKGEVDYDYKYDILFFKTSERDYVKSMELNNIILDLDKEGFIVGIQILEASEFLNLDKKMLLKIPNWKFQANVQDNRIEIRLDFQIMLRNKIIERNPIIIQPSHEDLPNSEMMCEIKQ